MAYIGKNEKGGWAEEHRAHIADLRDALMLYRDFWGEVAADAGVARSFVEGIAKDWTQTRNPGLKPLCRVATALERVIERETQKADAE